MTTYVKCPFCNEDDFDEIGLKRHLLLGWCPVFDGVPAEHQTQVAEGGK